MLGPISSSADGVAVNHIAKWDGSSWSALGSGVNDGIHALAADKAGNLYAGGHFTAAGGKTSPFTARWTAADGRAISGPATYTFYAGNLPVTVLVPPDGQGDLARINIQRFNTSYPGALPPLLTGYYWQLEGLNGSGGIASGYTDQPDPARAGLHPRRECQGMSSHPAGADLGLRRNLVYC